MTTIPGGWKYSTVVIQWDEVQEYDAGQEIVSWFLKKIADCFVERGLWQYDESVHGSTHEPIAMGNTANKWTHACFFVNTETGSKCMLGYNWTGSSGVNLPNVFGQPNNYPTGLLFSIIPSGKGNYNVSQGALNNRAFLGSDYALPVLGTGMTNVTSTASISKNSSSSMDYNYNVLASMYRLNSSCWYRCSFLQKDDCVVILTKFSKLNSQNPLVCLFGKILDKDTVSHPDLETEQPSSLYGAGYLKVRQRLASFNYNFSETSSYSSYSNTANDNCVTKTDIGPLGFMTRRPETEGKTYTDEQFFSEMQSPWLPVSQSCYGGNSLITKYINNAAGYGRVGPEANGTHARLVPVFLEYGGLYENNQYVYESLKDNFRGFIREDLLLLTQQQYTQGQTFGGGKYIYFDAGMCLGWDSDLNPGMTI